VPFGQPATDRVFAAAADPRITAASTLVLAGRQLRGPGTLVRLGGLLVPPPPLDASETEIRFSLAPLTSLRVGVQGVQVVQPIPMGEPETPHRDVESNLAAFVLHPTITAAGVTAREVVNSVTLCSGTVTVDVAPKVGRGRRVQLRLNELGASDDRPSRAYSFPAPKDNGILDRDQADTGAVAFSCPTSSPRRPWPRSVAREAAQGLPPSSGGEHVRSRQPVFHHPDRHLGAERWRGRGATHRLQAAPLDSQGGGTDHAGRAHGPGG
jgi:hypothetical protein